MPKSARSAQQGSQRQLFTTSREALLRIRNYLAGQVVGLTRDESILEEVVKCAFCRVYLDREDSIEGMINNRNADAIIELYRSAFKDIKERFPLLFSPEDDINLEPIHIAFIDQELTSILFSETTHDLIGDIYETFIGSGYRGQEGQFFTPKVAVRTLAAMTEPHPGDIVIDPACGSGSFLLEAARLMHEAGELLPTSIHGVDKDKYLVRLAQLHLALQFDESFPISCADSLAWQNNGFDKTTTKELLGNFTLVLTNPPFGAKIVAASENTSRNFDLAHKWRYSKQLHRYEKLTALAANPSPQVLFVERCLSLLAPGGRVGMVLPESVLSNPNHRHVVQYILQHSTPIAIIGMPESLFKTSGKGGTHTKVCLIVLEKSLALPDHQVFMAEAKWCGHDSRAREITKDDIPEILENYCMHRRGEEFSPSRFGFLVPYASIKNNILAPRFYNPEAAQLINDLAETHNLYKVAELIERKYLSISTGDEVGKLAYGTGDVPFVRTSDLSNWEIKVDPKHTISRETYEQYCRKQDIQEGDILMVRDGTYLIGTCALISRYDTEIVYQSHIFKIRVHKGAPFNNYLLLAALSSPPVVAQIKSMSFTQDIIDTLGDRINDLILPIPKSEEKCLQVSNMVRRAIESRIEARELTRQARLAIVDYGQQSSIEIE